jgi:hypothetical protein
MLPDEVVTRTMQEIVVIKRDEDVERIPRAWLMGFVPDGRD